VGAVDKARAVRSRVEAVVEDKNSVKAQRRLAKEYERICKESGLTAYPPGYDSVSLFISELVRFRQGSAFCRLDSRQGGGWRARTRLVDTARAV